MNSIAATRTRTLLEHTLCLSVGSFGQWHSIKGEIGAQKEITSFEEIQQFASRCRGVILAFPNLFAFSRNLIIFGPLLNHLSHHFAHCCIKFKTQSLEPLLQGPWNNNFHCIHVFLHSPILSWALFIIPISNHSLIPICDSIVDN